MEMMEILTERKAFPLCADNAEDRMTRGRKRQKKDRKNTQSQCNE